MHSNKITSIPPSHLQKYNPPQSAMLPQSPSKITPIHTNQKPTLHNHVPISSPYKTSYSFQPSKSQTLHEEPMKTCLKLALTFQH